ncbi:DUF5688 family protein [Butyrivibrio sp. FC2001]|uniref:DUF5688 family protein n=1 Tax=Butyrivibrio sp. FC2001 TaxID=1280671 RepID=UPI0003FADB0F|nr:DUF5688 family protein [Butyrivibrio sp. FC2001]
MNYEEFKSEVKNHILEYLPESYSNAEVSIHTVIKNNSIHLDGLTIKKPESNICPNIYLNQFFEQYENGKNFEEIMQAVASIRSGSCENPFPEVNDFTCLDKVKDKIHAKLVNKSRNEEYLQGKPFTAIEDLAVIYYIEVEKTENGTASIVITDNMLSLYGISLSELHNIALSNMNSKDAKFLSMAEMLKSMMPGVDDALDYADIPMYVLTNNEKLNGATMLLDTDTMDEIAKKIGMSFLILPSSIHETILVPASIAESSGLKNMAEMVIEVNRTQVAPEDILSDHVYRYSYASHSLEIAA